MTDPAPDPDVDPSLAYTEAMAELDRILHELEDESLDVDVVAARVKRAAALVRHCRARIRSASDEVERVVAELDAADTPAE